MQNLRNQVLQAGEQGKVEELLSPGKRRVKGGQRRENKAALLPSDRLLCPRGLAYLMSRHSANKYNLTGFTYFNTYL